MLFDPAALAAFALPKTVVSQSLAVGLAVVLVMLAMRGEYRARMPAPLTIVILAPVGAYALAGAFAADRYLAVFGAHDRLLGFLAVADAVVLAFALLQIPQTAAHARLLLTAAILGGIVSVAYGLLQAVRLDPITWSEPERSVGTLGNATVYGEYLALLSAGSIALAASRVPTARERGILAMLSFVFFVSALFITRLNREWHPDALMSRAGKGGPAVTGAAFAIAWTPCIGPTLGAILSAAALSGSAAHGALLLAVYSAGLAIPFLLTALAFSRMSTAFEVVKRHYAVIVAAGGAILVATGVLILTGEFSQLNIQAQRLTTDLGINP